MQVLILAYDAECAPCRRWMEKLRGLDCRGLLVFFPLQNPELVRMAPELAGRDLLRDLHGVAETSRKVFRGAELVPEIARRLPRWAWAVPLLRLRPLRERVYEARVGRALRARTRSPQRD